MERNKLQDWHDPLQLGERAKQEWISYCLVRLYRPTLAQATAIATPVMNGSFHSVAEKRLSGVEGFVDLANYSVKIVQLLLANYPLFFCFLLFPSISPSGYRFWSIDFNPQLTRRCSRRSVILCQAYFWWSVLVIEIKQRAAEKNGNVLSRIANYLLIIEK